MAIKKGIPRLSKEETVREIYNRTGLPKDSIVRIIEAYIEIIRESIIAGVEVSLRGLGVFTYKTYQPKDMVLRMEPKCSSFKKGDTIHVKGYRVPYFRITSNCKKEMREKTEFDYVEQ